jgi:hypothetical protein
MRGVPRSRQGQFIPVPVKCRFKRRSEVKAFRKEEHDRRIIFV